jgi:hypothetical protein
MAVDLRLCNFSPKIYLDLPNRLKQFKTTLTKHKTFIQGCEHELEVAQLQPKSLLRPPKPS